MRKVLFLALVSMFFAATACQKQQGTASSPEASPSEAASPEGMGSPAGGMASPAGGEASPAGGEASPAASPS
jgi:hypothetical protein